MISCTLFIDFSNAIKLLVKYNLGLNTLRLHSKCHLFCFYFYFHQFIAVVKSISKDNLNIKVIKELFWHTL